jgi:thiamine-monophosphate kinase
VVSPTGDSSLGEFEIIERYFDWPITDPDVLIGPGDDAALVSPAETLAIAADTLVSGVHFLAEMDPARLGHRVLAVNLSDMAAMAARPRWFTLALTLERAQAHWIAAFSSGLKACAQRYGVELIGGDVTAGPLCLSVQILGEVPREVALRRNAARPGDAVFVTGTLGDAAAGLEIAGRRGGADAGQRWLVDRYETPEPRVAAGIALRGIATAAIDVSDGLLCDLGRVCRASGCAAELDVDSLPLSAALLEYEPRERARERALSGGDDYELCFTAPAAAEPGVRARLAEAGVAVTRIGQCRPGQGVTCTLSGRRLEVTRSGYEHFS